MSAVSAKFDSTITATLGVLTALLLSVAKFSSASCARRYGHNADCGVFEAIFAVFYFAPLTLLFAFASLALRRKWRIAVYAHWLAMIGIVAIPFFDYALLQLTTH
jgi:hypothetical protein